MATVAPSPTQAAPRANVPANLGNYLIARLHAYGVEHVFGVPGDYVITLWDQMLASGLMQTINTCDEQGAGYAADAYARVKGLGAAAVVYGVGGFKLLNTTAQAYAEKSPVVVISGTPGLRERGRGPVSHHLVESYYTELRVFEQVTVASTFLEDPRTAPDEIDRVLSAALAHKRPVYIGIPRDMYTAPVDPRHLPREHRRPGSNRESLAAALHRAQELIDRAQKPVIWAGEELQRYRLREFLLNLVEVSKIPFASSVLGKGILAETHPLALGVYNGALAADGTREYVESSDCLITLGVMHTDLNYGFFTAKVDPAAGIFAAADQVTIGERIYEQVRLEDFVEGLAAAGFTRSAPASVPNPPVPPVFEAVPGRKLTSARMFEALNAFADQKTVFTTDNGETSWAGVTLLARADEGFFSPGYYASVGYSVPTAMGLAFADRSRRVLALTGDAAFQMTGVELSTMSRFGLNPIVVVMNNGGYGTERPLFDQPFDDIGAWNYAELAQVMNSGKGFVAQTEDQLDNALHAAGDYTEGCVLIDVRLDKGDYSPAFQRFIDLFGKGAKPE